MGMRTCDGIGQSMTARLLIETGTYSLDIRRGDEYFMQREKLDQR